MNNNRRLPRPDSLLGISCRSEAQSTVTTGGLQCWMRIDMPGVAPSWASHRARRQAGESHRNCADPHRCTLRFSRARATQPTEPYRCNHSTRTHQVGARASVRCTMISHHRQVRTVSVPMPCTHPRNAELGMKLACAELSRCSCVPSPRAAHQPRRPTVEPPMPARPETLICQGESLST